MDVPTQACIGSRQLWSDTTANYSYAKAIYLLRYLNLVLVRSRQARAEFLVFCLYSIGYEVSEEEANAVHMPLLESHLKASQSDMAGIQNSNTKKHPLSININVTE